MIKDGLGLENTVGAAFFNAVTLSLHIYIHSLFLRFDELKHVRVISLFVLFLSLHACAVEPHYKLVEGGEMRRGQRFLQQQRVPPPLLPGWVLISHVNIIPFLTLLRWTFKIFTMIFYRCCIDGSCGSGVFPSNHVLTLTETTEMMGM